MEGPAHMVGLFLKKSVLGHIGANTVTWIPPDPCKNLSASDSKLHTNLKIYDKKIF